MENILGFRDIPGYEGLYGITSCGKVWSYKRKKFLKPSQVGRGKYRAAVLYKDGQRKDYYLHRLVLEAYNPVEGMEALQVNHIDEDREHNYLQNLEWTTSKENNNHGTRNARIAKALSKPVRCVETGVVYESQTIAAAAVGLANSTGICGCLNGYQRTAGGYHWEYANEEDLDN